MPQFGGVKWKGNTGNSSRLENQAGGRRRGHGSEDSAQRERKPPGNRRTRRAQVGWSGIFAASIAAVVGLALGEGKLLEAIPEAALVAPAPSPQRAGEAAPVKAGLSHEPILIDPPAPPGSTSPALAIEGPTTVIKEHQILITWLEPGESGRRLRFARLSGQGWSQPVTVAEPVSTLGPTDRPSLTLIDTQAVRRTLVARAGEVVARSGDGGRTWSRLTSPALPFASFAGGEEGGYAFWLAADGDESGKLLGSRILAGEAQLDPLVAGGSGTSAAMTWDGPVVVYRDRNAKGAQDIAIVRRQDAQWTPPRPVHAEGWRPARMPTSGPQVAALRRQVAVAWYTEAGHRPRVLVAFSNDAGRTFGAPVEVATKKLDHALWDFADVALDDSGNALVLWMAASGPREVAFNLTRVSPDGTRGEELILAKGPPDRVGGIPQIARAGDKVAVTWIEGIPSRVRALAVPLAGIPPPGGHGPGAGAPSGGISSAQARRGQAADSALSLELVSLKGEKVSLASLRGRAVLLNVWATWCLPCIKEMPELATLHELYGTAGLVVVGVSVDDVGASDKVRGFVSERKIPFAVWLDPEMRLYRSLRVRGVPATFVIDREGRLVMRREGAITADDPVIGKALLRALRD